MEPFDFEPQGKKIIFSLGDFIFSKMASYLGIPVPENFYSEILALQAQIPADEYENFPHLTLDYLGKNKIHFAPKILENVRAKCADILSENVIFDRIISFENKNNSSEIIVALGANEISLKTLRRVYGAMNVENWHSKSPSESWIPHITLAKIFSENKNFPKNFPKNSPKIILPLSDIQIL